jgi:hypothetical protein
MNEVMAVLIPIGIWLALFQKEYEYDRTYIIRIMETVNETCLRKSSLPGFIPGQRN